MWLRLITARQTTIWSRFPQTYFYSWSLFCYDFKMYNTHTHFSFSLLFLLRTRLQCRRDNCDWSDWPVSGQFCLIKGYNCTALLVPSITLNNRKTKKWMYNVDPVFPHIISQTIEKLSGLKKKSFLQPKLTPRSHSFLNLETLFFEIMYFILLPSLCTFFFHFISLMCFCCGNDRNKVLVSQFSLSISWGC